MICYFTSLSNKRRFTPNWRYTRESFILSGGKNLTALEYAAKRNHEQIVEFLLPKVIVHKKPTYDNMHSAFHLANDKIQDIVRTPTQSVGLGELRAASKAAS